MKEYRRCKEDEQYFIEKYCWFFDSRPESIIRNGSVIFLPKLWPDQLTLLKSLKKFEPSYIEKSRDHGVSWVIMAYELHKALFMEGFSALNISRKEAEVEDHGKTVISLMGRLDFMYKRLPSYLKLRVDNPFLTFKVAATNSLIKGESANPNAGRDFQYTMIFVDEAAFVPCLDQMWKCIVNSTDCIIMVSTLGDEDTQYFEVKEMLLKLQKEGKAPPMKMFQFSWKNHPHKDQRWYAKKEMLLSDEDMAREIDMSYRKTQSLKIYPEFEKSFHVKDHDIPINPLAPLYLSFDFGLDDPEAVLFIQTGMVGDIRCCYVLDEYEKAGLLTPEHYMNIQKKLLYLKYAKSLDALKCYGDPTGKRKERTSGRSVLAEYESLGIKINIKSDPGFVERRRPVKTLLKGKTIESGPRLVINPRCEKLIYAFQNHQRKKAGEDEPKKDKTCHIITAFEFFCHNEFPIMSAAAVVAGIDPQEVKRRQLLLEPLQRRRNFIFRQIG